MKKRLSLLFTLCCGLLFAQNETLSFSYQDTSFVKGAIKTIEALDYSNDFEQYQFNKQSIDTLAQLMKKYKGLKIEVHCYSDFKDEPLMNLMATEDQAREIQYYLVRKGVEGTRIKPSGNGDMFPIYEEEEIEKMNTTEAYKANKANRRIEIIVSDFVPTAEKKDTSKSKGVRSYISNY